MNKRKFKPGDRVCYKPDGLGVTSWEYGSVVRNGTASMVFVIYDQDRHPKASYERTLYPEFEAKS